MGHYPDSVNSPSKARIYGPLPDHGRRNVSLVLHTTETRGMPSFSNGETAPHYVYDPASRKWTMWAEYEQGAVGTLRGHSRACHGNCQAFQVEILGYTGGEGERQPYVGDFTDDNYRDLAAFYKWAMDRYGIGSDVTPNPPGDWYWSGHRLSCSEWDDLSGLTCHGAVPENTHWDTGVLDLERIHALAHGDVPIPPDPDPDPDPDPGDEYMFPTIREGDGYINGPHPEWRGAVVACQAQLGYHEYADEETAGGVCAFDGAFGTGTTAAVVAFQSAKGLTPDGIVGSKTWAKLIDRK